MNLLMRTSMATWALWAGVAAAQGLQPDTMARFGGRYALDCAKADSPRVVVEPRQMRIEQGSQRIVVGGLMSAYSYFGRSPPPDFQVALIAEADGSTALVNSDAGGQYLRFEEGSPAAARLGGLARARFRHCNEAANRQVVAEQQAAKQTAKQAEAAARAPVAPGSARSPSELIRDPRFKPAYGRALGPLAREPWLAEMNGPAPELKRQRIGGVDYTVAAFCKPHDCHDHNAVLLYDAAQGRVYGLVQQRGRTQSIGSPPGPMLIDLNAAWQRAWGKGR